MKRHYIPRGSPLMLSFWSKLETLSVYTRMNDNPFLPLN